MKKDPTLIAKYYPGQVAPGDTVKLGGATRTVPGTQQASAASPTGMPRTQQSPQPTAQVTETATYTGGTGTAGPTGGAMSPSNNPLDFQEAIFQMDKKARNVQDLQDQKNALLGVLYQSNVSPDIMAKLTPDQALAIKSGRRELIDSQVRSINNQIEGRYTEADSALNYINTLADKTEESNKQLLDLLKDPEGQTFLKNNLTAQGREQLKNMGIDVEATFTDTMPSSVRNVVKLTGIPETTPLSDVLTNQEAVNGIVDSIIKNEGRSLPGVQNNPGNIKFNGLPGQTDSGVQAKDGGTFANYASLDAGRNAIAALISNAASGKSKSYGSNPTLGSFIAKYTGFGDYTPGQSSSGTPEVDFYKSVIETKMRAKGTKKDETIQKEVDKVNGLSDAVRILRENLSSAEKTTYDAQKIAENNAKLVLKLIDEGKYQQKAGIFGEKIRGLKTALGSENENFNNAVKASFKGDTAQLRKELFGATLTDNEQLSANEFFPSGSDTTEVVKAKLESLVNLSKLKQLQLLGLATEDDFVNMANDQYDIVLNASNKNGQESVSETVTVTPEVEALRSKYNY